MSYTLQTPQCHYCHKPSIIELSQSELERYGALQRGEFRFIQDALPEWSADKRELLITGTHPECWDAIFEDDATYTDPTQPAAPAAAPAASSEDNTPVVDTRTAQQKEIDEAITNGTWGIEYTTCQKCGYHNWTRKGTVYVCDTCGNETTTVVSAKGVKGYVGSGAIAPIANKAAAPETRYANAKQAQAAADAREAAYAAAVAAFQKQIAANEAAYLAAIAK